MGKVASYFFYSGSSSATIAALTAEQAEVQPFFGQLPINVLGMASVSEGTQGTGVLEVDIVQPSYSDLTMTTWTRSRVLNCMANNHRWFQKSLPVALDDDFTVRHKDGVGSLNAAAAVYLGYGAPNPMPLVGITDRVVEATADITADVWSTGGTTSGGQITDLDPRKDYVLLGGYAMHEDAKAGVMFARVSSPSMQGAHVHLPTILTEPFQAQPLIIPAGFRHLIHGQESIDVGFYGGAAEQPFAVVMFGEVSPGNDTIGDIALHDPPAQAGGAIGPGAGAAISPGFGAGFTMPSLFRP